MFHVLVYLYSHNKLVKCHLGFTPQSFVIVTIATSMKSEHEKKTQTGNSVMTQH